MSTTDLAKLEKGREAVEELQDKCETWEVFGFVDLDGSDGDAFNEDTTVGDLLDSDYAENAFNSSDSIDPESIIPNYSENDTPRVFCEKVDQAMFSWNAFKNTCPTVSNFKYNPKHCDPGFWCGCSDPSLENCAPSNDTTKTFWAGRYTENVTDSVTNEVKSIVYTGWASRYPDDYFRCNATLYCPGLHGKMEDCPKLCGQGRYCPTSAETIVCPEGHYCRIGSVEPTKCRPLDRCDRTGLEHPTADWYFFLVLSFGIVVLGCLTLAYLFLNKRFPFRAKQEDKENQGEEQAKFPSGEEQDEERTRGSRPLAKAISVKAPKFRINAKFSNLQLTLPNGTCIMQGVSGELKSGSFTAIMGPSGAGKSTFLSLLSGKSEPTGGTLEVNEEIASLKDFRSSVGFVPQEDIMLRELTVEENIRHSAFMRLPDSMSVKDKLERIYQTMESLDLLHIRNSVIGDELVRGISGGQRKRVNVAMELVADPSLLALDEPTSGLDSTTSASLCETLSELAMTGVTVAAVIHQPKIEILREFSNVLLLGVGGRTVYMGRTEDMESYFESIGFPLPSQTNPADFYMDVISGKIPRADDKDFKKEDLFDLWENHLEKKPKDSSSLPKKVSNRRKPAGFVTQTFLLFKRAVLQRIRVPQNTIVPVVLSASTGMLIGYLVRSNETLYYGIPLVQDKLNPKENAASMFLEQYPSAPSAAFAHTWLFTVLAIMLVSVVSLNTFGREQAVFKRENFSGTKPTAYWLAKSIESAIWLPLYAAVFVTVCLMFEPQPISVLQYFFVIWIAMLGDSGVAHIVSLFCGPANRGIVYLVCCLILIMLFSGVMIKYKGEKKIFQAFFTFWVAQGYTKGSLTPYENVFDIDLLNKNTHGYNLDYSFGLDMLFAILTAYFWNLVALAVLMYRSR